MLLQRMTGVTFCALLAAALGAAGWQAVQARPKSPDRVATPALALLAPVGDDQPKLPSLVRLRQSAAAVAFAFAADGETLFAIDADHAVHRWQIVTGKELEPVALKAEEEAQAISPGGKFLAITYPERRALDRSNAQLLRVREIATGKQLFQIEFVLHKANDVEDPKSPGRVVKAFFGPDGSVLATVHSHVHGRGEPQHDIQVRFWDTATGKSLAILRNIAVIPDKGLNDSLNFAFSPDGKVLAFFDDGVQIWDVTKGQRLSNTAWPKMPKPAGVPWEVVGSLALVRDNGPVVLLQGGPDPRHQWVNRLRWFDSATKEVRSSPCAPAALWHGGEPFGTSVPLVLNASREFLAAGSTDGTIYLWKTATGSEHWRYKEQNGSITALAFAREGTVLASASADGTILVRDIFTIHPEQRLLETAWAQLAESDAKRVDQACMAFAGLPKPALQFLKERLLPVPTAEARQVEKWLADLESNVPDTWRKASAELERLGEQVEPALRNLLADVSTERGRERADLIRARIDAEVRSQWRQRDLRAALVLERIGTAEARQLLEKLAEGAPAAAITKEAKAALARLDKADK